MHKVSNRTHLSTLGIMELCEHVKNAVIDSIMQKKNESAGTTK